MKKNNDKKDKNNKADKNKKVKMKRRSLFKIIKNFIDSIKRFFFLQRYPFMAPHRVWTGEKIKHPGFTDYDLLPDGWRKAFGPALLKDLKAALKKHPYDFYFTDIKEKYGTLRLYANAYSDEVQEVLSHYEGLSSKYCINCGEPATYHFGYYYLCRLCLLENVKDDRFASDAELFDYIEEFVLPDADSEDTDDDDVNKEA